MPLTLYMDEETKVQEKESTYPRCPSEQVKELGSEHWPLESQPSVLDNMENICIFIKWSLNSPSSKNHISRHWTTGPAMTKRNGLLIVLICMVGKGNLMTSLGSSHSHPSQSRVLHPFCHPGPLFIWPKILTSFMILTRSCCTVAHFPQLNLPRRPGTSFCHGFLGFKVTFLLKLKSWTLLINERKLRSGPAMGALASSYLRGGDLRLWGYVPTLQI